MGFYLEVRRMVPRAGERGVRFTPLDVVGVERPSARTQIPCSRL
jgi:hypothetical protein